MVSINISLRKDAYQFLRSLRSKDQSFSDVILNFKQKQGGIMRFYGALKDKDWTDREKKMKGFREEFEARL